MKNNQSYLLEVSVGEQSPFSSVIGMESGVMATTEYGVFTFIITIPDVTNQDIGFIVEKIKGICWYSDNDFPIGILMFLLTDGQGNQWTVSAPITGAPQAFIEWGNQTEGNACMIILVDSKTNNVEAIRSIGFKESLLYDLRYAARTYATEFNLDSTLKAYQKFEGRKQEIWNNGRSFLWSDTKEDFLEIR